MLGQCLPPFLPSLNLLCLGQLLLQGRNGCLQLVDFINETILWLQAEGQDGISQFGQTALQLVLGLLWARMLAPPGTWAGIILWTP